MAACEECWLRGGSTAAGYHKELLKHDHDLAKAEKRIEELEALAKLRGERMEWLSSYVPHDSPIHEQWFKNGKAK